MMQMNLTPPPGLRGDAQTQLVQMHSFLFQLTEQLNAALAQTDERIQATEKAAGIDAAEGDSGENPPLAQQYDSLKSLIIKTAYSVQAEMDTITATLKSDYIAKSEWGIYEENIQSDITATAKDIVESYGYEARLDSLDDKAADFDSYIIESNGYIRRGIIGYDDDNVPIIGIAIGQDLKSTTVEVDGETYEEIDMTRNLATYTSKGITFWQNGIEVAWFNNAELMCTSISVGGRMRLGSDWEISHTNGFTVKWIGGE